MPSTWLQGAKALPSSHDAGSMLGGNSYITWHTTENDPTKTTALNLAKYLISSGNEVHFVVHPISGEIYQLLPVNRAGRGLRNISGGVETNRAGRVHIQVEVVAQAAKPFTNYWSTAGKAAIRTIAGFARVWGVPDAWPAGVPAGSYAGPHNRIAPSRSGHYAHSQWKENTHWDTGRIDAAALYAPTVTPPPVTPPPGTVYKVVSGDTLYSIALRFKTTVAQLQKWNNLGTSTAIVPGMSLRVAGTITPVPAPDVYEGTVRGPFPLRGDDFYGQNDGTADSHSGYYLIDRVAIREIQKEVGVSADGLFGPGTAAAVKRWQTKYKLGADGKVGPKTWAAMAKLGKY